MAVTNKRPVYFAYGPAADRPATAPTGSFYFSTDTQALSLMVGSPATWVEDVVGSGQDVSIDALTVNEIKWGTPADSTVATGVLTVTGLGSYINIIGEGATTDTIDSVVKVGQEVGDYLLIRNLDADVMTFDNSSTLLLGAATRALAVGGSIGLIATSATVWAEVSFTATTT